MKGLNAPLCISLPSVFYQLLTSTVPFEHKSLPGPSFLSSVVFTFRDGEHTTCGLAHFSFRQLKLVSVPGITTTK